MLNESANSTASVRIAPERRTYTVVEIAEMLGIGKNTAYSFVKEGNFKIVRIGNTIRVSAASFNAWLDAQGV